MQRPLLIALCFIMAFAPVSVVLPYFMQAAQAAESGLSAPPLLALEPAARPYLSTILERKSLSTVPTMRLPLTAAARVFISLPSGDPAPISRRLIQHSSLKLEGG